ncbi:hypothetical protein RJB83_08365 [Staphylococcus epidermidis]|nr:hypothetical protein [Staphylococcus epidermidis]
MNKNLLKKYLNDDSFKSVVVVIGNKRIVLENDIHVDYENEVIIYPCKNCTRIIPFSSISYLELIDKQDQFINYFKEGLTKNPNGGVKYGHKFILP